MICGKKVIVVLPAYHSSRTLERTVAEITPGVADEIILVDDASEDATVETARRLGLKVFVHEQNRGYGANQKTCYREALKLGADIILMLHPDYQYSPRLAGAMVYMVASENYDLALGSRILAQNAVAGGMPRYKYVANRCLTLIQNLMLGEKLSEYHTGYRAFTRAVLESIPWLENSDDFLFDNQILCQTIRARFRIGEISCPAHYFPEASSIGFRKSPGQGDESAEVGEMMNAQSLLVAVMPVYASIANGVTVAAHCVHQVRTGLRLPRTFAIGTGPK